MAKQTTGQEPGQLVEGRCNDPVESRNAGLETEMERMRADTSRCVFEKKRTIGRTCRSIGGCRVERGVAAAARLVRNGLGRATTSVESRSSSSGSRSSSSGRRGGTGRHVQLTAIQFRPVSPQNKNKNKR